MPFKDFCLHSPKPREKILCGLTFLFSYSGGKHTMKISICSSSPVHIYVNSFLFNNSQNICSFPSYFPWSDSAVAWCMDYTDHAKLRSQVWHLNLLKVIVPEDIKRCRLCPPAPGGHVIPLQSVMKLLGLKQVASLTDKRLSLNSFFFHVTAFQM